MRTRKFKLKLGAAVVTLAALPLAVNHALAAEYWLRAAPTTVDMPGAPGVPMWGYAKCTAAFGSCVDPVTVPGPALNVPPGDTTLTVHLRNDLTVPTSLVINGQLKSMAPVWTDGTSGPRAVNPLVPTPSELAKRVRSFDAEASPSGGVADYTWPNVKPGTYLYQSGTQPQVQVQMGLYGALTKNAVDATATPTPAQAYAGVAYDNQATLLYSEIDPALHTAVANGTYGTAPAPTSTFDYQPKYFLINGRPYPTGALVIEPVGNPGQTLLRLLNAGLITHVPMIQGNHWELVAEDGKPYPWRLNQYTALLPAAKTLDVRLTAEVGTTYAIMDRRLSLSNNGESGGGMMAFLRWGPLASVGGGVGGGVGGTNQPPVANADGYDSVPGASLNIAAPGVLTNDTDADVGQTIKAVAASGTTAGGGTYALNANGSFTYTPLAGFTGADTFTYRATDGQALSELPAALVTITVAAPSSAPALSLLDNFDRADSNTGLGSDWSQTASTGSFPNVQIAGFAAFAAATDLGGQAIWNTTTFGATQGAALTASALGNSALILKATGGTTASPDTYIRVRYEAANGGEIVVATMMSGSTAAVFVRQAAFPTTVSSGTLSAAVDAKGLVTVFQAGAFVGGVQLPDVPAWKGGGRIGIQLQTVGATIDNFSGGNL